MLKVSALRRTAQNALSLIHISAARARKAQIPITTFMIARDPYLQRFIERFTEANQGRAFYTGLQGLADMVFRDHASNRRSS